PAPRAPVPLSPPPPPRPPPPPPPPPRRGRVRPPGQHRRMQHPRPRPPPHQPHRNPPRHPPTSHARRRRRQSLTDRLIPSPSPRGCSSMAELEPSKLVTRVRFPSPAPPSFQVAALPPSAPLPYRRRRALCVPLRAFTVPLAGAVANRARSPSATARGACG